jgi:hypothetical protein
VYSATFTFIPRLSLYLADLLGSAENYEATCEIFLSAIVEQAHYPCLHVEKEAKDKEKGVIM